MSVTYQRPEVNSFRDLALATKFKATVLTGSIQDIDLRIIMKVYIWYITCFNKQKSKVVFQFLATPEKLFKNGR
jgi:hypothetical protein